MISPKGKNPTEKKVLTAGFESGRRKRGKSNGKKPEKNRKNTRKIFEKGIDFMEKPRYNVKLYEVVALGGGM